MVKEIEYPEEESLLKMAYRKLFAERIPKEEDELFDKEDVFYEAINELRRLEQKIKEAYEYGNSSEEDLKRMEAMQTVLLRIAKNMSANFFIGFTEIKRGKITKMLDSFEIPDDVRKKIEEVIMVKRA